MSVSPSCVHDKGAWVLSYGIGESFGTVFDDDVTPTHLARKSSVNRWTIRVVAILQLGDNDFVFETWFARLTLDRAPVDCEISEICEEFLSTVLALHKLEELRSIVDKLKQHETHWMSWNSDTNRGPSLPTNKDIVCKEAEQEGNVSLSKTSTQSREHIICGRP